MDLTAPPIYVFWDVTGRCNLRCVHCRDLSRPSQEELTFDEGLKLIDDLAGMGVQFLGLLGGEPLLRKDILPLVRYAKQRMAVGLGTNGTLLTPAIAADLREAGLDICFISLDGPADVHDTIRGRGAYARAVAGITHLKAANVPVGIRMTLMPQNLHAWQHLIDLALDLDCELSIRRVLSCGRAAADGLQITREEYREAVEAILAYAAAKGLHMDSLKSTGRIMLRNRDPVTFVLSGIAEEVQRKYGTHEVIAGCAAGIANAYLDSVGNIYACASLGIAAGNVRNQPFSEVWQESALFHRLRDRDNLSGKCGRCHWKYICGGCRASAFLSTNDYMESDPFCMLDSEYCTM